MAASFTTAFAFLFVFKKRVKACATAGWTIEFSVCNKWLFSKTRAARAWVSKDPVAYKFAPKWLNHSGGILELQELDSESFSSQNSSCWTGLLIQLTKLRKLNIWFQISSSIHESRPWGPLWTVLQVLTVLRISIQDFNTTSSKVGASKRVHHIRS